MYVGAWGASGERERKGEREKEGQPHAVDVVSQGLLVRAGGDKGG